MYTIIPLGIGILNIAILVYLITLFIRFVRAVEKIADKIESSTKI
jgi:hypothetical protein